MPSWHNVAQRCCCSGILTPMLWHPDRRPRLFRQARSPKRIDADGGRRTKRLPKNRTRLFGKPDTKSQLKQARNRVGSVSGHRDCLRAGRCPLRWHRASRRQGRRCTQELPNPNACEYPKAAVFIPLSRLCHYANQKPKKHVHP